MECQICDKERLETNLLSSVVIRLGLLNKDERSDRPSMCCMLFLLDKVSVLPSD